MSPGQLLGERYRIESLLGQGGMGEVWRAYDLKLRLEVALKSLHPKLFETEDALELLRDEVRAAREVTSPNVCRLYDLIEIGDQELVSMEYVDGVTLHDHLKQHGPLKLKEANEIASQLLAGLETVHEAGLVHRDIKPENVMLTRAGRIVVMDFGLTSPSGTGSIGGTPAYMPPEQARGEATDARADVFSAGMVLAEMLSAEREPDESSRQTFWEQIRRDPPVLPESPWKSIVVQALSLEAEHRYATASDLARALEEVAFRVEGVEHEHPYPGLASFQLEDAEFFFGREAEVEAVWKRLQQVHLLGLMGPSGSGKSSFINAGLLPAAPEGWFCIRMAPSTDPFAFLGRALLPELETDQEAIGFLSSLGGLDPALEVLREQRAKHGDLLIVVDQFEELFTQSPVDVQERFAELLGRAALEADVHVLLSMRDDYLFRCQPFEILRPLFSELTPLGPPTGSSLRRAIVQPALRCGFRFENEAVVEEMLQEVTKERAALPLIAFTAAQLWERRDRNTGYLTRATYDEIGGVGGALAQHAETTLERIGQDQVPIVRELFRNLVTADGTRASRERKELLSVFDADQTAGRGAGRFNVEDRLKRPAPVPADRPGPKPQDPSRRSTAATVLDALIDSRLLTSYEIPEREGRTAHHRIEIIHESLLTAWPQLVRWQMQDAEGAKLRDELRAQAELWDQHGRADDYLWAGAAYLDFLAWRARYPGGLSAQEEYFCEAMTAHAERRRGRARMAVAAAFVTLIVALGVIGGFWWQSVLEARRAEAANLFSLAQLRLEDHPTAAVAYATASLEMADNPEVRRLALEALWRGPTEFRSDARASYWMDFSFDGKWLVAGNTLLPSDGSPPTPLDTSDGVMEARFSPTNDLVALGVGRERQKLELWSVPEGRLQSSLALGNEGLTQFFRFSPDGSRLITATERRVGQLGELEFRSWPIAGGEPDSIGRIEIPADSIYVIPDVDPTGSRLAWPDGRKVRIARLEGTALQLASATSVEHERAVAGQVFDDRGLQLATSDKSGTVRIWTLAGDLPELTHTLRGVGGPMAASLRFDPSGSVLAGMQGRVWDLTAPPDAEPLQLQGRAKGYSLAFNPKGRWLATSGQGRVSLWPIARSYPLVLPTHEASVDGVAFTPDGTQLVSTSPDGSVRIWPLRSGAGDRGRTVYRAKGTFSLFSSFAIAPDGTFVVVGNPHGQVLTLPLDGRPHRELEGFSDLVSAVAVSPQADLVAAGSGAYDKEQALIRIWDLTTGEVLILDDGEHDEIARRLEFVDNDELLVFSGRKLERWDLASDPPRLSQVMDLGDPESGRVRRVDFGSDERRVLFLSSSRLVIHDLETGAERELASHGSSVNCAAFDPTGQIVVSGDSEGAVRVGWVEGGEPHLLLGHEGEISGVAVSPDGRWIASGSGDKTVRLWPMPDLDEPPFHELPIDELLAKLESLTNLRAVRDPESSTGWSIELDPFPGWKELPTW